MVDETTTELMPVRADLTLRMAFQPRNIEEAVALAARVARSSVCPERYRDSPEDVFVAAAYGAEIGLTFMQSVQGVAVINGIPTIYGDHALGVVRASGKCLWVKEWIDETTPKNLVAHCETHRKGEPEPIERTFSEDDAETAHLLGKKGPWQTHPRRMLSMRARGFCLRDTYADVLRGLHLFEEIDGEELVSETPPRRVADLVVRPRSDDNDARAVEAELPLPAARQTVEVMGRPGIEIEPGTEEEYAKPDPDVIAVNAYLVERVVKRKTSDGDSFVISLRGAKGELIMPTTSMRSVAEIARDAKKDDALVLVGFDSDGLLMLRRA